MLHNQSYQMSREKKEQEMKNLKTELTVKHVGEGCCGEIKLF